MSLHENLSTEASTTPPSTEAAVGAPTASFWTGGLTLVIGLGLLLLGTAGLTNADAWPRWTLSLLGIAAIGHGARALGRALFGPGFRLGLWLAAIWVGMLLIVTIFGDLLPFEQPDALPLDSTSFLRPDLMSEHPLGTDAFGRDYLSRLVFGARVSLTVSLTAVATGLTLGTAIGVIAGYYRGKFDAVATLWSDTMFAFPALILLIALVAVLRPSLQTIIIATVALQVPTVMRLARANTYRIAERSFVYAAKALGAKDRRIILREIVPNLVSVLFAYGLVMLAQVIILEASLSFLGLGIQIPRPSWGNMIAQSQPLMERQPHMMIAPAFTIFLTVLSFSQLSRELIAKPDRRESLL